ncbi:MAG: fumarate reductase/succinate dehydrogenase flavoprotein subunit [Candidatus Eisenbacteria bacterium]|nr:fumarate reductase/succinate dehydrogenase flavoprotein subunit [Candidatus Eisenbacteria bacterium]
MKLDSKVPGGPLETKWQRHRFELKRVNPANRRKFDIIVVGTGLAGASAAASFGELGYNVHVFTYHDSPRRAHSIAAQGGINAAKNYQNDGDSVWLLFYDTIKGGDYRAREANVHRLAEVSVDIIDQCVAQGVPFARDYGGLLANRSFGGAQVSRTFYARGQTGQQLLLGAYSALMRQVHTGKVKLHTRHEMLDLVVIDGVARGIVTRNLLTGAIEAHTADAVVLATGGYARAYYLSTMAMASSCTSVWRAHKRGALFGNASWGQIHPTCIPRHGDRQSKLTLMSESLRNDGRVWVTKAKGDKRHPREITEEERDYYLERIYPSFGNLAPRDVSSRAAKRVCDDGHGVGPTGQAVYLDFADAIRRDGRAVIEAKYGNLFDMYKMITDEDPYELPMRIYPAPHYTMGGLWVDYNLMSNVPGLFVIGEANYSDHGANRLGASALMQGLADGYFVIPYTIAGYLAGTKLPKVKPDHDACRAVIAETKAHIDRLLALKGNKTVEEIHRDLGQVLWDYCGMSRNAEGLNIAKKRISEIRAEFWENAKVVGRNGDLNPVLESALRVAEFLELADLMVEDAASRTESCGCHLREESQTPDGEAIRDDENFSYVSAWEWNGVGKAPTLHKEELKFEFVTPSVRSYK